MHSAQQRQFRDDYTLPQSISYDPSAVLALSPALLHGLNNIAVEPLDLFGLIGPEQSINDPTLPFLPTTSTDSSTPVGNISPGRISAEFGQQDAASVEPIDLMPKVVDGQGASPVLQPDAHSITFTDSKTGTKRILYWTSADGTVLNLDANVESVNVDKDCSAEFKRRHAYYPKANCAKEHYRGSRYIYEVCFL